MRQLLSRRSNRKLSAQGKSDEMPRRSSPPSPQREGSHERVSALTPHSSIDSLSLRDEHTDLMSFPAPASTVIPLSSGQSTSSKLNGETEQRKFLEKTQYIPSKSGPPRVVSGDKKNKNPQSYRRCEDEPIHTPGTIQSFGALIGLKYNSRGHLEVRVASENSRKILGYGPDQLFSLPSFLDILGESVRQEMVARIDQVLTDVEVKQDEPKQDQTCLDVFPLDITFPFEPTICLWCAIHLAPGPEGLVICEFEEYSDSFYLNDIESAKRLPLKPPPEVGVHVTPEEWAKSTISASKPLPVLRIARQRENKAFSALDIFNAMTQAEKQISACKTIDKIFEVIVGVISELTGFHRVMFYRFDSLMNGCIEAELHNPHASPDIFRGMHFPASDIPQQAQDLYKINRIRILHDRDSDTARLVCRDEKEFEHQLDLTHSYLRAISPVHCKYLVNMGVRSTMSISVVIDSKLWGLVACHGYGDVGFRVTPPIRELCRNIGECAASNIQRILMRQRIDSRIPNMVNPSSLNPKSFVATSSFELLHLVEADFALLSIDEKIRPIGLIDPYQEALAIMSYLRSCQFSHVRYSHNIKADFPGLSYPPGLKTIGGLLLIPLKVKDGNHLLVFFRKIQARHVTWAGNPFDKKFKAGSQYLEPRSSFKRWGETVVGMSKEWTEGQVDMATVLATLYSRLMEISGEKAPADQSAQMSLIRTCFNEVWTPINVINSYFESTPKTPIDHRQLESLAKAKDASNFLINIMENLLQLIEPEEESNNPVVETFNLKLTATRVLIVMGNDTKRNGLEFNMSVHDKLPTLVQGNGDRFKQLIVFFASRASKRSNSITVNIFLMRTKQESSTILVQIQDKGPGMSEAELDKAAGEFKEPQFDDNTPVPVSDTTPRLDDVNGELSVDIVTISQYVQGLNGQIQVTSEVGKGTTFSIELEFEHPAKKSRKLHNLFLSPIRSPQGPLPSLPPSRSPRSPRAPRSPGYLHDEPLRKPEMKFPNSDSFSPRSSSLPPVRKTLTLKPNGDDQTCRDPRSKNASPSPTTPIPNNRSGNTLVNLNVLVAEADPLNLRILDERLSQWGHTIEVASDGQECNDRFAANPSKFDVILMGVKMPGVDGTLATRMIRFLEKESEHLNPQDPYKPKGRVSIIAVSAALYEEKRFDYIQSGFDGWIMSPINFQRLDLILQGVRNRKIKQECLYSPGQWDKGGWFFG